MKKLVKSVWRQLAPRSYWTARLKQVRSGVHEPELFLIPALADPKAMSVDVGAAMGTFIAHLLGRSSQVLAFEPRPRQAADLRDMVQTLRLPVRVESVALSDQAGTATLRMLVNDLGRSTIDSGNKLDDPDGSPRTEVKVPMKRLDDYALEDVGFLKIDVEGHELSVLDGASQLVARTRCNILIETEDRHHVGATSAVFEWMSSRGYLGYFLHDGRLTPVQAFDRTVHQNEANIGGWRSGWERRGVYVNNFMFVPPEKNESFLAACDSLGFARAA